MNRSAYRIRERIRNIPLVKEKDPRRWREVTLFLLFLLVLVAPVLFDITQQTQYVRTRYAIEALRAEKTALDQQYLRLRIERASLESLDLVAQRAGRELGLLPPEAGARIVLPPRPCRTPGVHATSPPASASGLRPPLAAVSSARFATSITAANTGTPGARETR